MSESARLGIDRLTDFLKIRNNLAFTLDPDSLLERRIACLLSFWVSIRYLESQHYLVKDIDSISINHWVLTDDAVFQNNSKMVTAKFRIMDDDTAGIDISPDSMSLVLNAGESQRITINQLSSEPISEVTLCLLNMNNIEGIKLSGCTRVQPEDWRR